MFLADPVSDPKTAEQVLMEVLVLLENAPNPEHGDARRSERRSERAQVIDLVREPDDLDDLEVSEPA